jgi:hypothetical protein
VAETPQAAIGTTAKTTVLGGQRNGVAVAARQFAKEVAMRNQRQSNRPVSDHLPRQLYWIIVGLAVWLVLSVWGFAGGGYTPLALSVVSLFIGIAVVLPLVLAAIARRHPRADAGPDEADTLPEWLNGEFNSHTERLGGAAAAVQILLPIAAIAFGMTIFALVLHFDLA